MRILIVEDEKNLANTLKKGLSEEGYSVDMAYDGEEGQFLAETEPYDIAILDITLPKIDGLSILGSLRKKGIKTPVLMLTARDTVSDKIKGLDTGSGMDKEVLERIFDRFYRADASRENIEGIGLGLSIAKNIVEKHQGRIEVKSEKAPYFLFTCLSCR